MSMDPLHGASPDARAECYRCGALVRVARVGRHDRHHEWEDELARRVRLLEHAGAGADIEPWPTAPAGADIEPDPDEVPVEHIEGRPTGIDADPARSSL